MNLKVWNTLLHKQLNKFNKLKSKSKKKNTIYATIGCTMAAVINLLINVSTGNLATE